MLKDYIEVDNDRREDDDLRFVEEYWSKKLATELTDPVPFEQLQQRDEYSAMEKYLSIFSKDARFVDRGCGRGEWTIFFQKKGFDVIGIDVSSLLIKNLKTRYPDQCFVRGDIR
jgi:trans-aconitate methyltransferase